MGATCGADVGCCKGNINAEEIVAIGAGQTKGEGKDGSIRGASTASVLRPRQDSIHNQNGSYGGSTTYI